MSRATELTALLHRDREEIEARIEQGIRDNRTADFTLWVENADSVVIEQLDHDFTIGANLFMLDQLETPEKNEIYKEQFAKLFNTATVAFYWDALEPEKGNPRYTADSSFYYRRPPIDPCLEFCEAHGITPKAHCLNYDRFNPDWLKGAPVAEVKAALVKRFKELSERYAHRIPCWEVLNEMLCENGTSPFYQDDETVEWSFRLAEQFFPANTLMFNEYTKFIFADHKRQMTNNRNPYYMLVERSIKNGARVDAIGMQFHFFRKPQDAVQFAESLFDLKHHYAVLDRMAKLGKPLQITEVTFPAFDETPEDYEMQAEVLRMFYRVWFSHPAMEGAIYWNLTDGYAWNAEPGDFTNGENMYRGGLLDFGMKPKPAYHALYDLFHKEYCTNTTAEVVDGKATFRGFYGKYCITCGEKTAVVEFKRGGNKERKVSL
ncbi:MAG: endo-1,4-beta-xylanase [Clostridia bacterium]|nr:endo-1,4-beta-xylanase [Clostridia bacterium]